MDAVFKEVLADLPIVGTENPVGITMGENPSPPLTQLLYGTIKKLHTQKNM